MKKRSWEQIELDRTFRKHEIYEYDHTEDDKKNALFSMGAVATYALAIIMAASLAHSDYRRTGSSRIRSRGRSDELLVNGAVRTPEHDPLKEEVLRYE